MYMTHRLMVIHPRAKYGRPMSNQKKVMGRTRVTRCYTHVANMVSQCQTIKKLWAGHESAQTDGHIDRGTDRVIPIYPPELRSRGV